MQQLQKKLAYLSIFPSTFRSIAPSYPSLTFTPFFNFSLMNQTEDNKYFYEAIDKNHPAYSQRIDQYLRTKFSLGFTRPQVLLRKKRIRILKQEDQKHTSLKEYKLKEGDVIYYKTIDCEKFIKKQAKADQRKEDEVIEREIDPNQMAIFENMILHEDHDMIIINKATDVAS